MSKEIIKSIDLDLTADLADSLINCVIDGGVFEEIPVIGSVLKIYRSGRTIKEKIFTKQLVAFLNLTNNVDKDKRKDFFEKINEEEKEKLGSKILTLLEKEDEIQKSKWYANALNLHIENKIEYDEFYDLLYSIERVKAHYTRHFYELIKFELPNLEREMVDHFHIIGLLKSTDKTNSLPFSNALGSYELSRTGKLFLDLIYRPNKEEIKKSFVKRVLNETKAKSEDDNREFVLVETTAKEVLKKYLLNLGFKKLMELKITDIGTQMDRFHEMYIFRVDDGYAIMKRK
ncbi:hypothetical protein [uncultured Arcticibacterium sp.]|uniref:hypothetical protein n=1 Tax=uncultured Arcticibacterium sp. TaxID=2173042 RepID=UPI0030FB5BE4